HRADRRAARRAARTHRGRRGRTRRLLVASVPLRVGARVRNVRLSQRIRSRRGRWRGWTRRLAPSEADTAPVGVDDVGRRAFGNRLSNGEFCGLNAGVAVREALAGVQEFGWMQ